MVGTAGGKSERPVALPCRSPRSLGGANTQCLGVFVDDVDAHCERRGRPARRSRRGLLERSHLPRRGLEGQQWWFMQRVRDPKGRSRQPCFGAGHRVLRELGAAPSSCSERG